MSKILVLHPGLQHSHQFAWAMFEQGLLQAYWSGVPVIGNGEVLPAFLPEKFKQRIKSVEIPRHLRRHPLFFQLILRAGGTVLSGPSYSDYTHRICHLFDWWAAKHISRLSPRIVVAYENSAFHTFRAAKAIGARCVLDAPSFNRAAVDQYLRAEQTPYSIEINRRKDAEVAAADLILTCSPLAAESYRTAGVSPEIVRDVLLGATLPANVKPWNAHNNPLHFVFAGALSYRKSIDLILEAFQRLHSKGLQYRVTFVGGPGEPGWVEKIGQTPHAHYEPNMSQKALYSVLSQADCLLLPSRYDSFGMVVAEALACGTPTIVSDRTGAKAIIEQFPRSGWIVDCNSDSLFNCLEMLINDRHLVFAAREFALEASKTFTWAAYRKRVGNLLHSWT